MKLRLLLVVLLLAAVPALAGPHKLTITEPGGGPPVTVLQTEHLYTFTVTKTTVATNEDHPRFLVQWLDDDGQTAGVAIWCWGVMEPGRGRNKFNGTCDTAIPKESIGYGGNEVGVSLRGRNMLVTASQCDWSGTGNCRVLAQSIVQTE